MGAFDTEGIHTVQYWLMKTEPETFSFSDLVAAPQRTTFWEGVRNYQARNFMRDTFRNGDQVLVYHSNIADPNIAGIARVVREGYTDPTALDPKSEYYDETAAKKGISPWVMVDIQATHTFDSPVSRSQLKATAELQSMMVLARGARLSVQPVDKKHFEKILEMGKPRPIG